MSLNDIKNAAQEISDAIAAVLSVDVTIADNNLIRVAATGDYKGLIGEALPQKCSFEKIITSKRPQFIENPNMGEECTDCKSKGNCNEVASIGYPILDGSNLVGIIGLIAFDLSQKEELYSKYDSLLVFLGKLSDMLMETLRNITYIKKLNIQDELIKLSIDNIDSGIICTDFDGRIRFMNSVACGILKVDRVSIIENKIEDLLPIEVMDIAPNISKEIKLKVKGKNESFIISRNPIIYENEIGSYVFTLNRSSKILQDAYSLMNVNHYMDFAQIIGDSKEITDAKKLAQNISKSSSTVMLRGESGTGKELFARAIHNESLRKNAPFIAINCASIPENLLESELFGYEEGAFTGANKSGKIGKFELANHGTLFLDEIGDLPIHLQPKLLRVLQDNCFTRLGGKDVISVNFRLITATNRNLEEMIEKGQFRDDLYYRLNVIPIEIPPLRSRGDDIDKLSEYGLEKYLNKLGKSDKVFSEEVKEVFRNYTWPGNIRELENCIEFLVNTVNEEKIEKSDLPKNILNNSENILVDTNGNLKNMIDNYEMNILKSMLRTHGLSAEAKVKIAESLEINLATLYRKLNKYNLQ